MLELNVQQLHQMNSVLKVIYVIYDYSVGISTIETYCEAIIFAIDNPFLSVAFTLIPQTSIADCEIIILRWVSIVTTATVYEQFFK